MKAKVLFISILLTLQCQLLFSQCISIELSIIWEIENDFFNKDSTVYIPKLNITYRNNCKTNYYFQKVSDNSDNLPPIGCAIMFYRSDDKEPNYLETISYYSKKYSNQNFNVRIRGGQYYGSSWDVFGDTAVATSAECGLSSIYHFIRYDYNLDNFWKYLHLLSKCEQPVKLQFNSSDILSENILTTMKDQFVFIKSGETFIDTYNLVGFQIIEGCFTFIIDDNTIKNYLLTTQYDSKMKKNVEQELKLPEVVGEYQLYSGAFNTNKVTVCFGER